MLSEQTPQKRRQPEHQVIADGQVIYEGENWRQAFLDASLNPEYGTIVHLENGEPRGYWGPPLHRPQ